MEASKQMVESLRERLKQTEGGIQAAAALGSISQRAATKIMQGINVRQATYDAFCAGLDRLEKAEALRKLENEEKAAQKARLSTSSTIPQAA